MTIHSSKSKLEQTHFDDTPSLRVSSTTKNKSKSQRRRKNKCLFHPNKRTCLEGKLGQLMKIFTPIPFKPLDLSSFSDSQENLLKRAGLWDFLHLKFDPELRSDLIAELIVGYNPQAPPYSRSFVNGRPVKLTRTEMGCALALPSRGRKVAAKEEEEAGERFCGLEVISEEEVLFLEKVVLKSVVLCGVDDGLEDDVLKVIRFIKEEREPERVDWRGLIWVMVEKELGKGVELRECYYASHLEWFLRKQRPTMFAKEVGKLGFYDLGVQKLELGISGVDEKESEKKVKGLVGHQRRNGKLLLQRGEEDKMVCSDICAMELGEKKSKLLLQRGEEDNVADVIMEGSYDNGVKQMENELADCLTEQGKDDQLRMDVLVEDEGLISVETRVEQELKEKQMENEPICLTQDKSDNRDLKIGKGSDVQMVVVSEKEVEDQSLGLCLLQGEMKMEGPLKEGEDTKMRSADDDNGKQMEITQMDISLEHGNSVLENQEKSMHLRQSEKAEVIVQEDFVKEDGAAVDVEVRSFGSSSGNELESTQIELCAGQTTGGNDFVEAVKKDCIVDFEDSEEKHKRQELFQNCSLRMDAGYESQSEKEVEVREEDNVDIKDMEDQDKESRFQHCSPNTDTLSDSISEKAVEISEEDSVSDSASEKAVEISDEDSPHGIVNDCSVVEPFELGTSMMDQDFFGNASNRKNSCENDVFVEPFVLEHDINANIRGSSVFENPLKTEIDLMNDGHKRLRTEGLSEKMPMPLKRKMNNTNDGHGIMRSGGRSNKGLEDFSSWGEQVDFWLGQTKMVVAAREDAWLSAQMEEQMLSKKLEQQDKTFHLLGKTKLEELEKRNSKINCIENELFFMANQIDQYKNALETTRMTFAAFRERCKLPEEPLYVDIPGSGGIVLSSNEWEKERLRREQEEINNRLDTMITTFQLHWFNQFDGPKKMIKSLGDRLSVIENEVEDLKNTFQNMIFRE